MNEVARAALMEVRRVVDEALRVLEDDGTPPLEPQLRSADSSLKVPVGCQHAWVHTGFGSVTETCTVCGAKRKAS